MPYSAIEHLHEFDLSWAELRTLPEDQIALFSLSSYAVSEINVLSRVTAFSLHKPVGVKSIDAAIVLQWVVLLRNWSAKMFEFVKCLEEIRRQKHLDVLVKEIVKLALKKFRPIGDQKGFFIARNLRNEATNHYSFRATKQNISHVSDPANCKSLFHEMHGNSLHLLGEEVVFYGRLMRYGASYSDQEEKLRMIDHWLEWNLTATNWIRDVHDDAFQKTILDRFPEKKVRKRTYWIPPSLVGELEEAHLPVFARRRSKS